MVELRLAHRWMDKRLNVSDIDISVEIEPSAINDFWTPDSYLRHAKKENSVSLMQPPASLTVYNTSIVRYSMIKMVTFSSPMSFAAFPFDTQVCQIKIQSFGYDIRYNNYTWFRPPVLGSQSLNLDNHKVRMGHHFSPRHHFTQTYPGLVVRLALQRKIPFHITQTYIPSIIFIIVAWISFFVPSDAVPGRMGLCITTLLTFTSMFNTVRSLTPQVSYMKAIDIWVLVCLFFVFSTLAEYGLVLHLTSRAAWQRGLDIYVR